MSQVRSRRKENKKKEKKCTAAQVFQETFTGLLEAFLEGKEDLEVA